MYPHRATVDPTNAMQETTAGMLYPVLQTNAMRIEPQSSAQTSVSMMEGSWLLTGS
jgi:hypothetical protein